MRAGLVALVFLACGPRVSPSAPAADDGVERQADPVAAARPATTETERPIAPPGKGLRTGTIARARLNAVLDAGPANFLRQLEVTARMSGDRFVGWQLVQLLDPSGPLHDVDVLPGDVLRTINGKSVARPEELQAVWDSLRTSNAVTAQLWRGERTLELAFTVDPPVAPVAGTPRPAR